MDIFLKLLIKSDMTSIGTMILSNQIYFLFLYSKITIKTLSYIHLLDICQVNTLPSRVHFSNTQYSHIL